MLSRLTRLAICDVTVCYTATGCQEHLRKERSEGFNVNNLM